MRTDTFRRGRAVRKRVWDRHPGACYTCGAPLDQGSVWAVDHIVPVKPRGAHAPGRDVLANLAPQCMTCSSRKSNRTPSLDLFMDLWDRRASSLERQRRSAAVVASAFDALRDLRERASA